MSSDATHLSFYKQERVVYSCPSALYTSAPSIGGPSGGPRQRTIGENGRDRDRVSFGLRQCATTVGISFPKGETSGKALLSSVVACLSDVLEALHDRETTLTDSFAGSLAHPLGPRSSHPASFILTLLLMKAQNCRQSEHSGCAARDPTKESQRAEI